MPPMAKTSERLEPPLTLRKKELMGKFNIVAYIAESKQFINMDHGRGKGITEIGAV
jgi:hypothetical protein